MDDERRSGDSRLVYNKTTRAIEPAAPGAGDRIVRRAMRRELTRIYDILAGINDNVECGEDGYARLGSLNDRDLLQSLCDELGAATRFSPPPLDTEQK